MVKRLTILSIVVFISVLFGLSTLKTPEARTDVTHFSSKKVAQDIKAISVEVHSVKHQPALLKVREYLLGRMRSLNLEPKVFTYEEIKMKDVDQTIPINNIFGKTPGDFSSYVLLVAHYDSSSEVQTGEDNESLGAADDGYGVATILEITRLIDERSQQKPLTNGVKVLLTDGNEAGLFGANLGVQEAEVMDKVSLVINVDARGVSGPVTMFETSKNDAKLINLYQKTDLRLSYSLADVIYRKMSKGTDFTEFVDFGYPGLNFAAFENLDYYRTKLDNYRNIDRETIQHYGEQIYPIVKEFISSSDYSNVNWSKSDKNVTFFTFFQGIFIVYSEMDSYILLGILVLIVGALMFVLVKNSKLSASLSWAGKWLGFVLGGALFGAIVSFLLALITGVPFDLFYMPKIYLANTIVLSSIILFAGAAIYFCYRGVRNGKTQSQILAGGVLIQLLFTVVMYVYLPGGAFLFLFPCILFAIVAILQLHGWFGSLFAMIATAFTIMLITPIIKMMNTALTVGALGILMLLVSVALAGIAPSIMVLLYGKEKSNRSAYSSVKSRLLRRR